MANQRNPGSGSHASSSRSQHSSTFSDLSVSQPAPAKAFFRIRSSLEQSLRAATRPRKPAPPPIDEYATITQRNGKGKEKAKVDADASQNDKEKSNLLRRLESKVTFRRPGRESLTSSPLPPPPVERSPEDSAHKVRAAGFTSFVTPSMRQGSMSSPSLHLSSQALPSPKSRPAIPASSSSNSEILATPTRERTRRASFQPSQRDISPPVPLWTRREPRGNGHAASGGNQSPSRHKTTKSTPLAVRPLVSSPSTANARDEGTASFPSSPSSLSPGASTPTRRNHDLPSPPDTPTPVSKSRNQPTGPSSRKAAASSGHLPLNTLDVGSSPRASSPVRTRSPTPRTARVVTPTQRGLSSSSTSHLPLSRASPSPTPRRPSIDVQRRLSVDTAQRPSVDSPRRTSVESPRRLSAETPRPTRESPTDDRGSSSSRPRAVSPSQRSYAQNRHLNMSSLSLSGPPNPEYRELIRTATSMLCKEMIKIPPHMSRSKSGIKDWEEVEFRTRNLTRSERTWAKGGVYGGSTSNLSSVGGITSSGLSSGGEERERRLFCEALRDGFVLCQYVNVTYYTSLYFVCPLY